ncbi:hypothetical protein [Sporosarcina psychrophila]|uniref:hypothetical protein n=1 Tax=Sporosarcina psychrophila TaxID=1476 RepID=UPI00078EC808|nr:hypothetical protein [Sporosarcina psychrophila]AMQ05912.1 hypothetical protein AZE41_08270 [Sporosarcina psychrophila]
MVDIADDKPLIDDDSEALESSIHMWKWYQYNGHEPDWLCYSTGYTRTNEVGKYDYNTGLLVEAEPLSHEALLIWDEIDKQLTESKVH